MNKVMETSYASSWHGIESGPVDVRSSFVAHPHVNNGLPQKNEQDCPDHGKNEFGRGANEKIGKNSARAEQEAPGASAQYSAASSGV